MSIVRFALVDGDHCVFCLEVWSLWSSLLSSSAAASGPGHVLCHGTVHSPSVSLLVGFHSVELCPCISLPAPTCTHIVSLVGWLGRWQDYDDDDDDYC